MSRLDIKTPSRAQTVVEGLYRDMERRIAASPPGLCPVDMSLSFLQLCHAQTCGKCVPCRIGLGQLTLLINQVLDGEATMETIAIIEKTARSIVNTADCAIGRDAARLVVEGLEGFRDDYEEHVKHNRCLAGLQNPVPCVALCPAGVDIPGYMALVGEGRCADAVRLIRKDNPFPTACAYICEHPCEARCRRNMVDDAVNIRGLKRFAADYAGFVDPPECAPSTGKKVAVLGGGPGGLSAAYYLQLMGHQTTVYEMLPKLGGMLRYGIPNYRLPKDRLDDDINAILKTGVQVKYGLKIGKDISIQELREQYDAVLITIGASTDKKLGLPGEDADGVLSAVQFLRSVGKDEIIDLTGKEVVVIGGGNVSMDAVRTAKRLGAKKVSILYRRRRNDMTALPGEIEGAVAEGIEIVTLKAPASLDVGEDHKIHGIYATPQMISAIRDGRASVKPTGEPDVYIPCDILIKAIGQDIESGHFEKAGIPVSRGKIVTLKSGAFENMPGVFAGGDCSSGPASVIKAIAAAKAEGDSVGGIIEVAAFGLPVGLGDPMFGGMENRIAAIIFGIPAVKGVEFGEGFGAARLRGSENNDGFCVRDGKIGTITNHCGGILGGITNGMPLRFRAAVKPTPSIFQPQRSVNLETMEETTLQIQGRHDPCIVPRAVPVMEAAAAIAIYDALLGYQKERM